MAALDDEADRLVKQSWASRSLDSFNVGVRAFKSFRLKCGEAEQTGPSPEAEVLRFIAHLHKSGKAASTVAAYVSAVSTLHKINHWQNTCDNYMVKRALKGVSRERVSEDTRAPVTPALLESLLLALPHVCKTSYEAALFKSIYLLAFFGLFRIGELVCPSRHDIARSVLNVNDLATQPGKIRLRVRFSKTDQTGKTSDVIICQKAGHPLCPVRAMFEFMKIRVKKSGPLFMHFDSTFVSRFQFNAVLKAALSFANVHSVNVKSHSFRIGGATNAIAKGVPYEQVQEMGRWKSDAAKRYIRPTEIYVNDLI